MEASAISWTILGVICFLFILPAVYSLFCSGVLDCSPAIHQGTAFHYLVQSVETEKGFWGGVAHSSSTKSLFSTTEMFPVFFTLRTGSVVIRQVKKNYICATVLKWSPFHTWFPRMLWFSISIVSKQNPKVSTSIMIKHPICIHQSTSSIKISFFLIFTFSRYPTIPQNTQKNQ